MGKPNGIVNPRCTTGLYRCVTKIQGRPERKTRYKTYTVEIKGEPQRQQIPHAQPALPLSRLKQQKSVLTVMSQDIGAPARISPQQ